jgi:hypothetical protein
LWRPSPPPLHLFLGEREETGERKQMEGRSGQQTRAVSGGDSQRHSQALDGLLQPTPPPSAWLPPTPAESPTPLLQVHLHGASAHGRGGGRACETLCHPAAKIGYGGRNFQRREVEVELKIG